MSETPSSELPVKSGTFAKRLPAITVALLLIVYFRVPRLSSEWPFWVHLTIRLVAVAFGVGVVVWVGRVLGQKSSVRAMLRLGQHQMGIPLEGWIYLGIMFVLFTGAMLTNQNPLMLVFAFMAGPFVINGWMTFGMLQSARIHRDAPRRAMLGELFSVDLTLENQRHYLSLWMISICDQVRHAHDQLEATVLFSRVSPKTSLVGQYELSLSHRGRYDFGPLRLSSRFPLGLIERSRAFRTMDHVLIYPRIGKVRPNWRQKVDGGAEQVDQQLPKRGVYHDDFHRLREFRPGDNPRDIHWRSTARRGELILREYYPHRDHVLSIVLDLYRDSSTRYIYDEAIESALSFVVSLLVERGRECHDGILTMAAAGEDVFRWEGQGNSSSLELLFDGLSVFQPGAAADISGLLNEAIQHSSSSTELIVMTTRSGDLPYQSLLTSRVGLINLNDVPIDMLLAFDDLEAANKAEPQELAEMMA